MTGPKPPFRTNKPTSPTTNNGVNYDTIIGGCKEVSKWTSLGAAIMSCVSAGATLLGNLAQIKKGKS